MIKVSWALVLFYYYHFAIKLHHLKLQIVKKINFLYENKLFK